MDDLAGFDRWHLLFDELCNRRGYVDNAMLAGELCSRAGKSGREDFHSAEKKLRNWRHGRHVPLRRNFVLLTEILRVEEDAALLKRWNLLYKRARRSEAATGDGSSDPAELPEAPATPIWKRPRSLAWTGAGAISLTAALFGASGFVGGAENALPLVYYHAHVRMVVGESRLIHGDRGDCNGPAPGWEITTPRVPDTPLGTFSDGGLALRPSAYCDRAVPVRAVRFTASRAGSQEIRLLDDFMKITVVDVEP